MHIMKKGSIPQIMNSTEYSASNMESLLMFLATLVGVRTNLCEKQLFNTNVLCIYVYMYIYVTHYNIVYC